MIKNYFKIAWRNLLRNKTFSIINIAGLAIGLCCFLLIVLYVLDELNYDRYNEKADRIYRINSEARMGAVDMHMPLTSDMMGELLKKDYPEIEQYTRIYTNNGKQIKKDNEYIQENNVAHVDSTFFQVFTLPAVEGNVSTALNEPDAVVITASAAKRFLGTVNAVGKTLEVKEGDKPVLYKINAVIKDIPHNSHFRFDMLFSMRNAGYQWGQIGNHNFYTYLLLKKGTDYRSLEKKFPQYIEKYLLPHIMERMNIKSIEEFRKAGNEAKYTLIPLTKIHLYSNLLEELSPGGNIQYVYIFSVVALFILLIACINFMNLTTASSAGRAREVGIRKVLGTDRRELVIQFLAESTLMALLSLLIAVSIACLILPLFNNLVGKSIHPGNLVSPVILPLLLILPFAVGLLAGSYPAFFLSAFKPIEVLKGKLKLGSKSGGIRSMLVVFQFATSIILIIGTLVVYQQLHYIQHKNPGFTKEQVLVINGTEALGNNTDAFKNEVLQLPGVKYGTVSSFLPVSGSARSNNVISKEAVVDAKSSFNVQNWAVDYDYLQTMDMKLVKGRNFSRDHGDEGSAVIINETTAKILGYADPVGKKIYAWNGANNTIGYTIIGVVKNFNYETLHQNIGPLALYLNKSTGFTSFKISAENMNRLITQVKDQWDAIAPGSAFSYRFLDASFNAMYRAEQQAGKIAIIFSALAIFIACMGIFGLATFIAEQRRKEIGIRKVLGASVQGIVKLLSGEFLRLVVIAFIIAAPFAWWAMSRWLEDFAYRVSINWWVFLVAGATATIIALITVSFQSVKAALMNPLKSLSTE